MTTPKTVSDYLATIGRKGGEATTPAKQAASRANGKKGGRPKKVKKGADAMRQAQQTSFNGGEQVYRWFVWVGRSRFVTWAATEAEAIRKTEARAQIKAMRLKVDRVEPAPPLIG